MASLCPRTYYNIMGTLSLFSFGSPTRGIYPEVLVEMDGSVLASSFFVSGILTQYDFPTSFNDLSGRQLKIHYLNDSAGGSALTISGLDVPVLAFANASAGGIENRVLFLTSISFDTGKGLLDFDWKVGNHVRSSNAPPPVLAPVGFSAISESSLGISMSTFTTGKNIKTRIGASTGIITASIGTMWLEGFVEFTF